MKNLRHHALYFSGAFILLLIFANLNSYFTNLNAQESKNSEPSKLLVVWASADREVALKMVYMYTYNAKKRGWFDNVRFLIWGPSSKLISEDTELQDYLKRMKDEGVELLACKACADMYGVSVKLEELGVEVKYMGEPLSEMLKSDWVTMTF
ncbi:DsrE family protein [Candidatus Latescibacterota bacterium]